jgi:hypothetical protein
MRPPVVDHPSIRSISSEPRTQQPLLCRSLCSQLASSPYDNHRRRPCSQLARDRTTAHPAPTFRRPLLPTSKPAAHKLFQHPQVMYHPLFFRTHHKPNACSWRVWWRPHEDASRARQQKQSEAKKWRSRVSLLFYAIYHEKRWA